MASRLSLLHQLSQQLYEVATIAQALHVPVLVYLVNMAKLEILNQIGVEHSKVQNRPKTAQQNSIETK